MNKYKIAVYAISKNESKFVDRWYNSIKDADYIYVLDTGSTDNTVELLKKHKINVFEEIIKPWRFDTARNKILNLLPIDVDICISLDLDEIMESGWRKKIETCWKKDTNRLHYTYNWSIKNNKPIISFISEKIHDRKNYKWIYPVHEVLKCSLDKEKIITNESIVINHYPDNTKSRSSYLPLLELSIKENPNNERNLHYLGREYMFYKKWNESIDTLLKHIKISTWNQEKSASMRFIARCYTQLNRINEARFWLKEAIKESPNTREAYTELALLEYNQKNYLESIYNIFKAKSILKNNKVYINEPFCWDSTLDDLLSLSLFFLGIKDDSLYYLNKALKIDPTNERLINNKNTIEKSD